MKKLLLLASVSLLLGGVVSAAPSITWGSSMAFSGPTSGQYDVAGTNGLAVVTDYLIELVFSDLLYESFSTTNGFTVTEFPGVLYFNTTPDEVLDGWNGLSVTAFIYNASEKTNATMRAEFTKTASISWDAQAPAPLPFEIDLGVVTSTFDSDGKGIAGEWQAIPEPAVAAMIGLFGGGLFFVKRLFV